uniref:InlB B-repeat-containing protein n=1 Tax=Lachnospira sp. TaxID=2049031 RepID=UPI003FEF644F
MKRLLSILLCSAMLVTALPGMYYSQGFGCETVYAQENESTVQEIDYQLNGGHYVSGYKAPLNYPVAELPDKDKVINQGYEFGGWYDNAELTGEPVTKINQGDYTGVVVLYAKWVERYYYIDIPQSVDTFAGGTGEVQVAGHAGGLYEKDKVSVSVSSDNEWKLISKNSANVDIRLGYGLYTDDNNEVLADNSVVSELTATDFDKAKKYFIRLTDTPEYAGTYSDSLTFDIAFETTKYNIKYVTNGGTLYSKEKDEQQRSIELKEETYEAGTSLSSLPSPGKEGAVFLGWCYDSSCTEYVSSDDRLLSDVVLYAAWTDTQELRTVSLETYARSYDVDANDFSITVTDKTGSLTADEVSGLIKIKNTSDMLDEISAFVSAKAVLDGEYTFSINNPEGWQQGSSYRLELDDDRLYFTGYDTTIREYDFTVYKPDVRNTELNKDIKYISSGSISDLMVDGKAADSISVSAMTVGVDGTITDSTKVTGSFTYVNDTLSLGDKIAVYEGNVIPSLDTEAVTDDDVSFFEITSADDSRYTYRGLAAKEILFVPDVLPVNIKDDKDNDVGNNSVIIAQDKLTYDNVDAKDNPSLGEDTTIDNGDYLALYNDGDDNIQYAVITEVSKTDTDYIIVYSEVSWEEVQAAMDIYQTDSINGDTILKN